MAEYVVSLVQIGELVEFVESEIWVLLGGGNG